MSEPASSLQMEDTEFDIRLKTSRRRHILWFITLALSFCTASLAWLNTKLQQKNNQLEGEIQVLRTRLRMAEKQLVFESERKERTPERESDPKNLAAALYRASARKFIAANRLGDLRPIPDVDWQQIHRTATGINHEKGIVTIESKEEEWAVLEGDGWDSYIVEMEIRPETDGATLFVQSSPDGTGYLLEVPCDKNEVVHAHDYSAGNDRGRVELKNEEMWLVQNEWQRLSLFVTREEVVCYVGNKRACELKSDGDKGTGIGFFGWSGVKAQYRNIRIALREREDK
ncbi:MAG: hypothetical protein QF437_32165 [Planctomycetota bacterium]|nr:hypothetical protein [Planctomycetota bacterium]MDP7135197.1 hypothetical protein [Planctomycetota bacterium]MDP7252751.1 hypothetical protein [Planctomycetota bacterium]